MTEEFIQIFNEITEVHEAIYAAAVRKQEGIVTGEMSKLEEVLKEESALIQQLRKLENTRQHLVQRYVEEKGLETENITMEKLLPFFPEAEQEELYDRQQQLLQIIGKLKEQNELNQQLLEDSLSFVTMSLDAFTPQNEFNNYRHPSGKQEDDFEPGGRSLFDTKA
nr:flagellar protein FlgN [Evansella caseinilytica]